ncbi:ABC transporter substrate-binding protein [Phytopseudomonas dryadis]|uniref:Polyamine ABC transporter substrate-binding protein n=1 Tax=Phytopseudomonas dryadis TaxID=2487520 RepID=A0A4Q9QUU9_9GAMM|nr:MULTISPECIES: ABC transporter substrate-binding protein [Pseudomonas]TBU86244.1 polyamine ABC transporter substrate-binding protein [Pseudomonas dryadis]TBV07680.1 polyamine ABC transporter substrate-binding protein [Pseudomonas dryadis]TBV19892.1 polyamine ABC transporter substrate-binding protein [Pseudomonas sp. FRB 230]
MNDRQSFIEDALQVAEERMQAAGVSRRGFNQGLLLLAAAAGLGPWHKAFSASGTLVVANWGGDAVPAFETSYKGFSEASGLRLMIDGSGPSEGALKTQVSSGAVRWDVCDGEMYSAYRLGAEGFLTPIDYSVVDKSLIGYGDVHDFGLANYTYSYVIGYDRQRFGDNPPKSWADFWDVKKYPGKRTLYKWMSANLECALLADGVPPEQLYPLDVDRALRKIEELMPHVLTHWSTGAESQQLLRDGEVSMAQMWHTRAELVKRDTGGRVDWSFDDGIVSPSVWMVPKNNPAGTKAAMAFIAYALRPEVQALLMEVYNMGPVDLKANELLSPELQRINPTAPENLSKQVSLNNRWHAEHYGAALERYLALIGG